MPPSEKTQLRRLQRAGQRQRDREALAKAAGSPSVESELDVQVMEAIVDASPQHMPLVASPHGMQVDAHPQVALVDNSSAQKMEDAAQQKLEPDVFMEALLAMAAPSKKFTAEEFAEQVCQLVDAYRAGLSNGQCELEPSMDAATQQRDNHAYHFCCVPQPVKSEFDDRKLVNELVSAACPYTVRNTFIDVLPSLGEVSESQKTIFSTWPEDKPTVPEDDLFCGGSIGSHSTYALDPQLEAGEIIEDYEEGQLSEEEDSLCDFSVSELCAFTTGNWQTGEEPSQISDRCVMQNCTMGGPRDNLKLETEGLKDLLRQTLDAPLLGSQHFTGGHVGRWRKGNGETKEESTICEVVSCKEHSVITSPAHVLSLESTLLGGLAGGWSDVRPQASFISYA